MAFRRTAALGAPILLCLSLFVPVCPADNLIRNASFEHAPRDVFWTGYNRYSPLRQPAMMRMADLPAEKRAVADGLPDELSDREKAGEGLGWRVVEQPDEAFHGKRFLACNVEDSLGFGLEIEGGAYTLSAYVRGGERDVLKFRIQDIRGHKGVIRNDQE